MKLTLTVLSLTLLATQSFAGLPDIQSRGRLPVQPAPLSAKAYILSSTDMAYFGDANAANITVDKANDQISITLLNDLCAKMPPPLSPLAKRCALAPVVVDTYTVRLESIKDGACGSVIYSGSEDRRPVDGALTTISVTDSKDFNKNCESLVAVPATTGSLEFAALRGTAKTFIFQASELK